MAQPRPTASPSAMSAFGQWQRHPQRQRWGALLTGSAGAVTDQRLLGSAARKATMLLRSKQTVGSNLVRRAITALAKMFGDDKLVLLSVGSGFRPRVYRASLRYSTMSDTAQTISSTPRHHESQGPGTSFTKAANAAIQTGFMTPPTNSSAIKAQQQPTQ